MKLREFLVKNYKSVLDSNPVRVGDITCLVGKNEAGKTSLLKALYTLNPIRREDAFFNVTDDYPRAEVADYEADIEIAAKEHAEVVVAQFELEPSDTAEIEKIFGPRFLSSMLVTLNKNYDNTSFFNLLRDETEAIRFLARGFSPELSAECSKATTAGALLQMVEPHAADKAVASVIDLIRAAAPNSFGHVAWEQVLRPLLPEFMYFDEYYQLTGCENIQALQHRVATKTLQPSDLPLLGLMEVARLKLDQILAQERTQNLKIKLEGAGIHLTKKILPFWSQNKHLQMRFDVRAALPKDPPEMRQGVNIWGEVYDTKHFVSTSLGARSRGFVWFFSFVAWYAQIQRAGTNVIILLDEPGLTLHGRAQSDLLRYFEEELRPAHQLIYSTHSPFMIDPNHFERVRIVQDLSIDNDNLPREKDGTKVIEEVFEATEDSLFPLQGALGYEMRQTLFIGPNSLLIESPADLLFIQAMSGLLEREGRIGLESRWTFTPVGGSARIPTFVRFLTGQCDMTVATLIDIQQADQTTMEGLYKSKLLKKGNVHTFADYTGAREASIEDMFEPAFYIDLVNAEFAKQLSNQIRETSLTNNVPRIVKKIEAFLDAHPMELGHFSAYRPARFFHDNIGALANSIHEPTKDRFERAFIDLNAILSTGG